MVEREENGEVTTYEWNADNNLTKVTLPGGKTRELTYNGDKERVSRIIDGEKTQFVWNPQSNNVIAEYDGLGNEQTGYGPQLGMDDPWVMQRERRLFLPYK